MGNNYTFKGDKLSLKRVFYEGSDVIKKGFLLCPNYDVTTDLDGDTIAEGDFNHGRFLRVEKPTTNAIPYGVLVAMEERTGPCDITVAEMDGHCLQVYTDGNVTAGADLYAQNASYLAGTSGIAKIGLALETIDRHVSPYGLVGARLQWRFT